MLKKTYCKHSKVRNSSVAAGKVMLTFSIILFFLQKDEIARRLVLWICLHGIKQRVFVNFLKKFKRETNQFFFHKLGMSNLI
jgi:hypothetical protein